MHTEWQGVVVDDILERVEQQSFFPTYYWVDPEDIEYVYNRVVRKLYARLGKNRIHFSKDPDRNRIWVYERSNG
jgi:hypothetical protein